MYLSPPFRFKNFIGNPCLQHIPETAVSSRASNLPFDRISDPAWKSLQSLNTHKIIKNNDKLKQKKEEMELAFIFY